MVSHNKTSTADLLVNVKSIVDKLLNDDSDDNGVDAESAESDKKTKAALIAFAAGLADDLSPVRDRINQIQELGSLDEKISAIKDLSDALPTLLAVVAKASGGSDALESSMTAGYQSGLADAAAQTDSDHSIPDTDKGIADEIAARANYATLSTQANLLQNLRDKLNDVATTAEDEESANNDLNDLSEGLDFDPENKQNHGLAAAVWVAATALLVPAMTEGYGWWSKARDEIDDFPCLQLYRMNPVAEPRPWPNIWLENGGTLYPYDGASEYPEGDLIAEFSDPIWYAVNEFGDRWPPMRFRSQMGIKPVPRDDAVDLGVIDAGDEVEAPDENFNDNLKFSGELDDDIMRALLEELNGGGEDFSFDQGEGMITNSRPRAPKLLNTPYQLTIREMRNAQTLAIVNSCDGTNEKQPVPFRNLFLLKKSKTSKTLENDDEPAQSGSGTRLEAISSSPLLKKLGVRK